MTLECANCDCAIDHLCINCDHRINVEECNENNGFCAFCASQTKGDSNENFQSSRC